MLEKLTGKEKDKMIELMAIHMVNEGCCNENWNDCCENYNDFECNKCFIDYFIGKVKDG
jgi:hypothetical protein